MNNILIISLTVGTLLTNVIAETQPDETKCDWIKLAKCTLNLKNTKDAAVFK